MMLYYQVFSGNMYKGRLIVSDFGHIFATPDYSRVEHTQFANEYVKSLPNLRLKRFNKQVNRNRL